MSDQPSTVVKHPGGRARPRAREELARLHVRGLSNRAIAKKLGCAEETVCRWLKEPGVQKQINELGAEAKREVKLILERGAPQAARTMVSLSKGQGGKNWQMRRAGASEVLDRSGFGRGERHELEHSVQGNAGAVAIALAIEKKRKREGRG